MVTQAGIRAGQENAVLRRWERLKLNLPIHLIMANEKSTKIMTGRGGDISEGGILICAGAELHTGDEIFVEVTPPYVSEPIRVRGVVRHRRGYNYGVEFVWHTPVEQEQTERFRSLLRLSATKKGADSE